mgnify:CR=1 FL=1
MPKNFKLSSTSFKGSAPPSGKQNRTGTLGRVITDIYRDVDAGFKTMEDTIAAGDSGTTGFVNRVYSGKVTITNPATASAEIDVPNAPNASVVIVHNNNNAPDAAAVRFTGSVSANKLTITTRNAAGVATAPGATAGDTLELHWWVDGR